MIGRSWQKYDTYLSEQIRCRIHALLFQKKDTTQSKIAENTCNNSLHVKATRIILRTIWNDVPKIAWNSLSEQRNCGSCSFENFWKFSRKKYCIFQWDFTISFMFDTWVWPIWGSKKILPAVFESFAGFSRDHPDFLFKLTKGLSLHLNEFDLNFKINHQ